MLARSYYQCEKLADSVSLPVSPSEAKEFARLLGSDVTDLFITSMIKAAVDWLEVETNRSFCTKQYKLTFDQFPYYIINRVVPYDYRRSAFILPVNPVISVDSITYTDTNNDPKTLTEFQLSKQEPARVVPARGQSWPFADPYGIDTVNIVFTAGYATVPDRVKIAVLMLTSHFIEMSLAGGSPVSNVKFEDCPHGLQSATNRLRYAGFVA